VTVHNPATGSAALRRRLPPAQAPSIFELGGRRYLGNLFYGIAKNAVCRMARGLTEELRDKEVAVVALSPGWVRVERMTGLSERQEAQTESVAYVGRGVAALVADPGVVGIPGSRWRSVTWPEHMVSLTSTGASRLPVPSVEFGIQQANA
jgi:NAD(P)-dependent dehydrogenase (short-subunit alcohol dehydrogenase family)